MLNSISRAGAFAAICLILLSMTYSVGHASPGWSWTIQYQLDKSSYQPDSSGTVSISLVNKGDVRLHIKQAGIQFDWQSSDKWFAGSVNVYLDPGQQANLGTVSFTVPAGVKEGTHRFLLGVEQEHVETYVDPYTGYLSSYWKDDGIQMANDYDNIQIEALKAVLTYVSVTGIPSFGSPIFVGETSRTVAVISNTGNAKASAVKVVLEDLSPSTGLVVSGSDTKDIDPLGTAQWVIEVRGDRPGTYQGKLRVYVGTQKVLEQDWQLQVSAPEIAVADRELSPQADQAYVGDTITITYTLKNTSPVAAKQLTLDVKTSEGLTILDTPTLTEIGSQSEVRAAVKVRADKLGPAWVQITLSSYGVTVKEDRVSLTISERPLWQQPLFIGGLGVGVAALVAVVLMRRRRPPKTQGVLLNQPAPVVGPSSTCPRCGKALTYVQAQSKWYCTRCKEYI